LKAAAAFRVVTPTLMRRQQPILARSTEEIQATTAKLSIALFAVEIQLFTDVQIRMRNKSMDFKEH
jgi:hypothetical protein